MYVFMCRRSKSPLAQRPYASDRGAAPFLRNSLLDDDEIFDSGVPAYRAPPPGVPGRNPGAPLRLTGVRALGKRSGKTIGRCALHIAVVIIVVRPPHAWMAWQTFIGYQDPDRWFDM